MFNFLKIFQKEKKEETIELQTDLASAHSTIGKIEMNLFADFYNSAAAIHKTTISLLDELAESAQQLGKSKVKADMDPRLQKRVVEAQEQISNKTISACENVAGTATELKSFNAAAEFWTEANHALTEINKIGARQAEFAEIAFKREMDNLGNCAKKVKQEVVELGELLKTNEQKFRTFKECRNSAKRISEMLDWINKCNKEKIDKEKEIERLGGEIEKLNKDSKELEASEEYKSALREREKLNELEIEFNQLKQNFRNSFGSLEKPIRKYLHSNPSAHVGAINKYFVEPIEGLVADRELSITGVLRGLSAEMRNGKIEPDEKLREKLIERCSAVESEAKVCIEKFDRINGEIEKLKSSQFVLENASELKDRISLKQKQREALAFEIQRLGEETIKKKDWISKAQKDIQEKLKGLKVNLSVT